LGDNAIYHMARVLLALEQYALNVVPHLSAHPLCGHPTLSVGLINGGLSVNTIPDRCTVEIDRRVLPGDDPEAAWRHAVEYVNGIIPPGTSVVHDTPFMHTRGLADNANGELAAQLAAAAQKCEAPGEIVGVPYGTDAPHYAAAGCPSVVLGPGSIEQAHTVDEWLAVEQLERAADVYYELLRSWE
jgi:acetylornithine deacetylase